MSSLAKCRLPAELRNEIRRTAALKGLAYVYSRKTMSQKDIISILFDCYHGNDKKGIASQVEQIVAASPPFNILYDKSLQPIVSDSVSLSSSSTSQYIRYTLKKDLTLTDTPYQAGREITRDVLEKVSFKTNSAILTGRTILKLGNGCLRTIKKAIAIALPLVDSEGNPVHSGTTIEDVKEKVLNEMYAQLKGKSSFDDEVEILTTGGDDDGEAVTSSDGKRPAGWYFHGWMAFLLYGPLAPVCQRIPLLEVGDSKGDNGKNSGRAAQRKVGAKDKTTERKNDTDGDRGMTLAQRLGVANLKLRQHEQKMTSKET
jgi:hypothetical protein